MTEKDGASNLQRQMARAQAAKGDMRVRSSASFGPGAEAPTRTNWPNLLIIDDEYSFLNPLRALIQSQPQRFPAHFHMFHIYPNGNPMPGVPSGGFDKLKAFFNERPSAFNAIYVDANCGYEGGGLALIKTLQNEVADCAFMPFALMTAKVDDEDLRRRAGQNFAIRFMPKFEEHDHTGFLHRALFELEDLQGLARTRAWSKLNAQIALEIQGGKGIIEVAELAGKFLIEHMGVDAYYFREVKGNTLEALAMNDLFNSGKTMQLENAPDFQRKLVEEGTQFQQRLDDIGRDDVGLSPHGKAMLRHRALAMRIGAQKRPLGVFTLYRKPAGEPFGASDADWFHHLATQLGNLLVRERAQQILRGEKVRLADLLETMGNARTLEEVAEKTVEFLNREFLVNKSGRGKATFRTFRHGMGDLRRRAIEGDLPLSPGDRFKDININDRQSVCARVAQTKQAELHQKVETLGDNFIYTSEDVRSCLTVPLQYQDACFGVMNLEHADEDAFDSDDVAYANKIATAAASALARQRANVFLSETSSLLDLLALEHARYSASDILDRCANLLSSFTGYSTLLILRPDADGGKPWRVDQVYTVDPEERTAIPGGEEDTVKWRNSIVARWNGLKINEFVASNDPMQYVEYNSKNELASDVDMRGERRPSQSQLTTKLYDSDSQHEKILLCLLFEHKSPLTEEHVGIIENFSKFMSRVYLIAAEQHSMYVNYSIHTQEAYLGRVMGQIRHSINAKLVTMAGRIADWEHKRVTPDATLTKIKDSLSSAGRSLDKYKHLVKTPNVETVQPVEIWQLVINEFAELSSDHGVIVEVPGSRLAPVAADKDILQAVFETLVDNAIRYAGRGATVRICQRGDTVDVTNDGTPVQEDMRSRLFTPGESTNSKSTGIGLYLARLRMSDMGGRLEFVESNPEKTTFSLYFPTPK